MALEGRLSPAWTLSQLKFRWTLPILGSLRLRTNARGRGLAIFFAAFSATVAIGGAAPVGASALALPPGFQADTLEIPRFGEGGHDASNALKSPIALDWAPDGKMFVAEHNGEVMVFDSVSDKTPTLALDIDRYVMERGDRGLMGMKLDPEYPAKPYIYLSYTYNAPIGGQPPVAPPEPNNGDGCEESPPEFTGCVASGRIVRIKLDPATGIAFDGPVEPPQQLLVESWCDQFTSHTLGDIEFDSTGALLAGSGDGATWAELDHGQFGNACGDPPNQGGMLRAQDLRSPETPTDPTGYDGSIIRINRETGEAMPEDPLAGGTDIGARRILAYGFRNPFRFELRPDTDELWIGDVGWYTWEELDRASSPPAPGQAALNFGWPCYEGYGPHPEWKLFTEEGKAPLCQSLYETPGSTVGPIFTYVHNETEGLLPDDACKPSYGASVSGLAFYEPPSTPSASEFPASMNGALFMADSSRSCVWVIRPDAQGVPDPTTIANFATHEESDPAIFSPVDITEGPEGALYIPNFGDDSITRIRYFADGQPPVARLGADRAYGPSDLNALKVHFNASASADPEGGPLNYEWDLDGDGVFDDAGDTPETEAEFEGDVNVDVAVRVTDDDGNTDEDHLTIYPGDVGPPQPQLTVGPEDWTIGDPLHFSATATDPDGEQVRYLWNVTIKHCPIACHTHPFATFTDIQQGGFSAPSHEYPSHLEFTLTTTDERGLSTVTTKPLFPRIANVEMLSEPTGVELNFNTQTQPAPFAGLLTSGGTANVSAPEIAEIDGHQYEFVSWSDKEDRSHAVEKVIDDMRLVAKYRRIGLDETPRERHLEGPKTGTPPTIGPAVTKMVTLSVRSKPVGISLRVDGKEETPPLTLDLGAAEGHWVVAPSRVVHHGRTLHFERWADRGSRRRWVTSESPTMMLAVYGPARHPRRPR
jgi:glucose/arabinose dehydrogenase